MSNLIDKLIELNNSDIYPFHMPGHKRRSLDDEPEQLKVYKSLDITEITGFDDLHNPEGLIRKIEIKAEKLYGAKRAFLLINGSSAGVLSSISAVLTNNKKIVFARNAHKSAYNALFINDAKPHYIWLSEFTNPTICGGAKVKEIDEYLTAVSHNNKPAAVYITSPTYEGILSDVRAIADAVHKHDIPLIVDAAHGAHLGMLSCSDDNNNLPSPIECGADIVITSLHKTLNSPTQTGLLLLNSERVSEEKIRRYLSIYQTSSPSYLLMAGIENCIDQLLDKKEELFEKYQTNLLDMYQAAKGLKYFKILNPSDVCKKKGVFGFDIGKIVITLPKDVILCGCTNGREISAYLLNNYKIETEYSDQDFVLAMSSYMDTPKGLRRLVAALEDMEKSVKAISKEVKTFSSYPVPQIKMSIKDAMNGETEKVCFSEAEGRICADYLYAYPPGIPVIVPGEMIEKSLILAIKNRQGASILIRGIDKEGKVLVVKDA